MVWITPILVSASLWSANGMPTSQSEVSGAPNLTSKVLLKRQHGRIWKPLNNRHHQWQFPKTVDCGKYKDVFGYTQYDGDYLMKETWDAAEQTYNPYSKSECDWKVECYRGFFGAYADKNLVLNMEFKVKDDVQGVGQQIQFDKLYIARRDKTVVHHCTSPDIQSWLQVETGNQGGEFGRKVIDRPPDLSM